MKCPVAGPIRRHRDPIVARRDPRGLAIEFRRRLHSEEPDLTGWMVPASRVRETFPLLCRAEGAECPFKDFARELGKLMLRIRKDTREQVRRIKTLRYYVIDPPATL
jgi:hypothetical protein